MEKIIICIQNQEDASNLISLLSPFYVVENFSNPDFPLNFDLCIIDLPNLKHHDSVIQSLKEKSNPVFLPFLLLAPPAYAKLDGMDVWLKIDEILFTPIRKRNLYLRCKTLLRTRELCLNLKAQQNLLQNQNQELLLILNTIEGPFIRYKVLFDQNNHVIDAIIIDVNDAYEQITHLKRDQVIGKSIKDIQSLLKNITLDWIRENYTTVHTGPIAELFFNKDVNRIFSEHIFYTKPDSVNVLFFDITERNLMEDYLIRLQTMDAKLLKILTKYSGKNNNRYEFDSDLCV